MPESDSKIKVVHLLHTIAYGGVETILINWCKKLQEMPAPPIEITLVCFENPGHTEQAFLDAAAKASLRVRTIPWSRRKPFLSSGMKLARIIREQGARVLHTHNTYADLTGLVAAKLTGVRAVSSVYVWSDFGWKRNALQWINEQVLRWFDAVAAQCRTTMKDTCGRGIRPDKVRVLPSGFEVNRDVLPATERMAGRKERGAADSDVVLINMARLYPEKAQAKLLHLTKELVARDPRIKLWILGVGPLEDELHALARELKLNGHVKFLGFCDNPPRVLKLADIQVHPSFAEGVPMSILAGMACALPVVASGVGGIPEVLESGKTGLLVPAADQSEFERAFSEGVLSLVTDQERRLAMGSQAARFIENEYSLEAGIKKLDRLYRDVLNV